MPVAQIDLAKGHTFAGAPPGSGKNFAKLKTKLAARGARNPGALAAFIGRRKYGKAGFAKLAHHAHSNPMEFAMPTFQAVTSPWDIIVSRGADGNVIIRHRNGGAEIGALARTDAGGWQATVAGKALAPRTHQRTALADVIGNHNKSALTAQHRPSAGEPLQPVPRQTPLMEAYGIPAVRALATPTAGVSDGPRTTDSDSDDDSGNGLSAKGQAIYKKLKAKGLADNRAMALAKRAQNMGGK